MNFSAFSLEVIAKRVSSHQALKGSVTLVEKQAKTSKTSGHICLKIVQTALTGHPGAKNFERLNSQ